MYVKNSDDNQHHIHLIATFVTRLSSRDVYFHTNKVTVLYFIFTLTKVQAGSRSGAG